MLRQSLRDAARALSLANLFFIGAWIPILDGSYDWPNKFDDLAPNNIIALILDVLLLAGVFFGVMTLARRSRHRLLLDSVRLVFLFALPGILYVALLSQFPNSALPPSFARRINYFNITELRILGSVGLLLGALATMGRYRWIIAGVSIVLLFLLPLSELQVVELTVAIIATLALIRWHRRIIKAAAGVALIFFPLFLWTVFQSLYALIGAASVPNAPKFVQRSETTSRVVWIIFDEMDYSLSFAKRPPTLALPEFDRLRDQSLYASNAYPPADYTLISMPALITGRFITKAKPIPPADVMLTFEGTNEPVSWSSQPNIFSRSLELGVNTAVIGWYHPYQKIIGGSVTFSDGRGARELSIPKGMLAHLRQPMKAAALQDSVRKLDEAKSRWQREAFLSLYEGIAEQAKKAAAAAEPGLILIHYPIPHPPGIYDRVEGKFVADGESSYLDGLALADRSLGELRRAMEDAGLWDSSFVLVSSDHWWRPYIWRGSSGWSSADDEFVVAKDEINHRVPFLLKAAGQVSPVVYDGSFNTVLTQDLLLSILRGEISSPVAIGNWIDQRRSIAESPYGYEKSKQ